MIAYKYYVKKIRGLKIMANKFSDFSTQNNDRVEDIKKENPELVNNIESLVDKYSNLSSEELFNEFIKETNKGKENGTISAEYLNNIKSTLSPYLNNEQKNNLNNLMDIINDK